MLNLRINMFYVSAVFLVASVVSSGTPVPTSSVLDGGGGVYSNASFAGAGAIGQGTPLGFTTNPAKGNYSGFLQTYVDRPDLDNDADGIADENDTDDDNDGLTDLAEVTGSGFDPVIGTDLFDADTDDDGVGDGDESVAGTNPRDADSLLEIKTVDRENDNEVIEWKSRQGKTYDILHASNIFELAFSPETAEVVTVTSGGVGHFLETTTTITNSSTGATRFYNVKVKP